MNASPPGAKAFTSVCRACAFLYETTGGDRRCTRCGADNSAVPQPAPKVAAPDVDVGWPAFGGWVGVVASLKPSEVYVAHYIADPETAG